MAITKAKRASNDKWDAENMAYQTVKVRRELLDAFKKTCSERGDRVNTIMRLAMQNYVDNPEKPQWADEKKVD